MGEDEARGDALLGVVVVSPPRGTPEPAAVRRDRQQAVRDLLDTGSFRPHGLDGPFLLRLGFRRHRIAFEVRDRHGAMLREFAVPLGPLRPAIGDYRMIVEAHLGAIEAGGMARIQAIDQARRSVHDEAAAILARAIGAEAAIDHETARRLFTLIYTVEMDG
ncbi:MAG: UPF0262 family protein [Gluconacetobacter diazotrophicus]|nr:UPF0262 family protein [Gluconacetobacter diazotrophicus]